ncbi:MAG: cbb3-type cytochrome c oxidase subunit I, partial [Caldilinea sp.]|uniref:cbb3-type cytochrome c oxidase subunit I n=1 Tax=Caldilinea sp. TaxID=2293560 RepID=UPI0030B00E7A
MSVQAIPGTQIKAQAASPALTAEHLKQVDRIAGLNILVAILALSIGALLGVFQGLEHARVINIYPWLQPVIKTYYQGLTLHGALNAIVWTTFFICGFFTFAFVRSLNRPLKYLWMSWLALGVMVLGLLTAAVPMLTNQASVLYTFYPPMLADWAFYVGLTLLVVGSWIVGYSMYFTYYAWRKENPEKRAPFIAL